jgi:methylenetetrahydrofolate reductase (NADPH)
MVGSFSETLFRKKEFAVTCELIPGRGHIGKSVESIMRFVESVKGFTGIHALSITDNAGGNPALSADVLGAEIIAQGVDIIVHFACKDMNRNFIESRAYALQRSGVSNLLIVTGDYPVTGYLGLPKPVFDMDSVNALVYLSRMNEGLPVQTGKSRTQLSRTQLLLGAVVSPFKWAEATCVMQYFKLEKKVRAGARFIVTQIGYDARKLIELLQYVRGNLGSDIPLLGSVYVLTLGAAEHMHRGEVPGSYVPVDLLEKVRAEAKAEDKGRGARLERAARQIAILKGLGYNGAHIEGLNLKFEDIALILTRARELESDWQSCLEEFQYAPPSAFYLYEGGEKIRIPRPGEKPVERRTKRKRIASLEFWTSRAIHKMFFIEGTVGYRMMAWICRAIEPRKVLLFMFSSLEYFMKRVLFSCRACDDCAFFETFYVCPEARCPKGMRVGPCGGSRFNETCEVFSDRYCLWRIIYWRAKNRGECEKLRYIIPPRDWKLYQTSSWVNYFLKRDHFAQPIELGRTNSLAPEARHKDA